MATVELSMTDAMKNVALHVVVTDQCEASVRVWIGTRLIALAARIMGCGVNVSIDAVPPAETDQQRRDRVSAQFTRMIATAQDRSSIRSVDAASLNIQVDARLDEHSGRRGVV